MGQGNNKLTETERAIEERDRNPSTEAASQKRRGRPRKPTGEETTQLLGLAHVAQPIAVEIDVPGTDQEDKPKKKPGRPKGASKKVSSIKVDTTNIELILLTVSGIVASRPGMEIWNLSPEESKQLAEPIASLLSKNEAFAAAAGEHAEAVSLIMAVFAIFIPKFLVWKSMQPTKPKKGEVVQYESRKPTESQQPKGTVAGSPKNDDRQPTHTPKTAGSNFGGQLSLLIAPTAGF